MGQNSKTPKPDSLKSDAQYRLKKRLYMRQKHAQSTGSLAINTEAIRLRPGPTTQRRCLSPNSSIITEIEMDDEDSRGDEDNQDIDEDETSKEETVVERI